MLAPGSITENAGSTAVKKLFKGLDVVENHLIGILLIVITFVLFGNVVLRYFFNSNLGWAEEFSRYGVVWITLIGASACVAKGAHITVDAISRFLSAKGRRVLEITVIAVCIACTAILFWYSLNLTLKITRLGQMSSTLGVPMMYVYGAMPVGFFLMGIRFVEKMIQRLQAEGESTDSAERQGSGS
jgi:C4-dicarboxylate transporter, DctQ subunit